MFASSKAPIIRDPPPRGQRKAIPRSLQEAASGVESATAGVAETVDARDLKSLDPLGHVGSTPTPGTNDFSYL